MRWWKWLALAGAVGGVVVLVPALDMRRFALSLPPAGRPYAELVQASARRWAPAGIVSADHFATVLAAIIGHESHWGLALMPSGPAGTGDHGNGLGLGQLDRRYNQAWLATHDWRDPAQNLDRAAEILAEKYRRFPHDERAAIASYNASAEHVAAALARGEDPQGVTTHGNYVDNIAHQLVQMAERLA